MANVHSGKKQIAVFIDFENIAYWAKDNKIDFKLTTLMEYLYSRGSVIIKRAYGDFGRLYTYQKELMEHSIDMIHSYGIRAGKNRADIRMAIDAVEIAINRPEIGYFVIISGDSDFGPLVNKLREFGHYTLGIGPRKITHDLLVKSCDEFVYLDTILGNKAKDEEEGLDKVSARILLRKALLARGQQGEIPVSASQLKQTMLSVNPAFNEADLGYSQFKNWLEDNNDLVKLIFDGTQLLVAPVDFIYAKNKTSSKQSKGGQNGKVELVIPVEFQDALALKPVLDDLRKADPPNKKIRTSHELASIIDNGKIQQKKKSFNKASKQFLKASFLVCDLIKSESKIVNMTDLEYAFASYASAKAGALYRIERKPAEARKYYLAFFYLVQEDTPLWKRMSRLVDPLLSFYWASGPDELGENLSEWNVREVTSSEIALAAATHENKEVRDQWQRLAKNLVEVNPKLVRKTAKEMEKLRREPKSTAAVSE